MQVLCTVNASIVTKDQLLFKIVESILENELIYHLHSNAKNRVVSNEHKKCTLPPYENTILMFSYQISYHNIL